MAHFSGQSFSCPKSTILIQALSIRLQSEDPQASPYEELYYNDDDGGVPLISYIHFHAALQIEKNWVINLPIRSGGVWAARAATIAYNARSERGVTTWSGEPQPLYS